MNQIAVVNQGDKVSTKRVIVLPGEEFDALIGRPGYQLSCENARPWSARKGSLVYVMGPKSSNRALPVATDGRIDRAGQRADRISEYFEAKE